MAGQWLTRRDVFKSLGVAAAGGALGSLAADDAQTGSTRPTFSIAGYDYDRVRAISTGRVGLERADVQFHPESIYGVNRSAFGPAHRYDITELGFIPYVSQYINNDFRAYTAIPVFISRVFRHRNIFVRTDAGINKPEDLKGKRVGTPGYGMSANTWIRGFLLDDYGVKADDLHWIETAASSDKGKTNKKLSKYYFADGFPLTHGPEGVNESQLIVSGQCEACISAITPRAFLDKNPNVRRLFTDARATEIAYYKKTRLFPIMHVVAIRTDLIKDHPWLPAAVFDMYSRSKHLAYGDLAETGVLKVSLPWASDELENTRSVMGDDYWRYGIKANHMELDVMMRYVHEQGLTTRRIGYEELFHPSTLGLVDSGEAR